MAKSGPYFPPPQSNSITQFVSGLRANRAAKATDESSDTPQPALSVESEVTEPIATVDRPPAIVSASETSETSSANTDTLPQICDIEVTTTTDETPASGPSEHVNESVVLDAVSIDKPAPGSISPIASVVKQAEVLATTEAIKTPVKKQNSSETTTPRKAKAENPVLPERSNNSRLGIMEFISTIPQAITAKKFVRGESRVRITEENATFLQILIEHSEDSETKGYLVENLVNHFLSEFFTNYYADLEQITIQQQERLLKEYQNKLSLLQRKR